MPCVISSRVNNANAVFAHHAMVGTSQQLLLVRCRIVVSATRDVSMVNEKVISGQILAEDDVIAEKKAAY